MRHLTPVSRVVGRQTLARHRNPWPLSASSTAWFSTAALHSTALPASALIPSPNASRGLLTAALTLKLLACGVLLHLKHKPASFSPIPLRRLCVQPASSLGVSFLVWATLTSTQTITSNYRNRYALYLAAQFNISRLCGCPRHYGFALRHCRDKTKSANGQASWLGSVWRHIALDLLSSPRRLDGVLYDSRMQLLADFPFGLPVAFGWSFYFGLYQPLWDTCVHLVSGYVLS
ncbi:hypothetical protein IWX49DRAFT_303796 [Phyllosticta citricarpa]